jgi:hypothetical protein
VVNLCGLFAWLWQPELRIWLVELRCHWLLRLISERQTEMSVVSGVVSMDAVRLRDACCGKGGHDYRGCHPEYDIANVLLTARSTSSDQ